MVGPGTPDSHVCPDCGERITTRNQRQRDDQTPRRILAHFTNGEKCPGSGKPSTPSPGTIGRRRLPCHVCGTLDRPGSLRGAINHERVPLCRACYTSRPSRSPSRDGPRPRNLAKLPPPPTIRALLERAARARTTEAPTA